MQAVQDGQCLRCRRLDPACIWVTLIVYFLQHDGNLFLLLLLHFPAIFLWFTMPWNACVHRLDVGLYSHPKEFRGSGVRIHVNSQGKIPLYQKNSPQRRIEPGTTTLHQAGQQAQHTISLRWLWTSSSRWSVPPLSSCLHLACVWDTVSNCVPLVT